MRQDARAISLLIAPGIALAMGAVAVAFESLGGGQWRGAALVGIGVVLVWAAAIAIYSLYPGRPIALLLFMLAAATATQTLVSSSNPYLFTAGRLTRPAVEVLLVWVMLAFPSGHLKRRREKILLLLAALAVPLLWLPAMMFARDIPVPGPLIVCQSACPQNMLFVADHPALAKASALAFRVAGALAVMATAYILFARLRHATLLLRRMLAPVLIVSIARALSVAVLLVTGGASLGLTFSFWAVPVAIVIGLLRARLYLAKALQRLVAGLRSLPDMAALRHVMAQALTDQSLDVVYWVTSSQCWVDGEGRQTLLPVSNAERAVTMTRDSRGDIVAALVHDAALLEVPALTETVASCMLMALERNRNEVKLHASQMHMATALEGERRRIERDLHDGAQQRLIALRMKLGVIDRLLEQDRARAQALILEADSDVQAAMIELRAFTRGIGPPLLAERGLMQALAEAAIRAPIATRTRLHDVGRFAPAIEGAVYFCCTEALQNAAKHAGPHASAEVALWCQNQTLFFSIDDDGQGLRYDAMQNGGQGLANMRARIEEVNGDIHFHSASTGGARITGSVPIPDASVS